MTSVKCPSCGTQIALPPQTQKSSFPWWAGCLIAAAVIPVAVAILGILAAIAIPNFIKARSASQENACIANMKQIEGAKEQWALSEGAARGEPDANAINQYLPGATTPRCPAGGTYTYHALEDAPECSEHGALSDAMTEQDKD